MKKFNRNRSEAEIAGLETSNSSGKWTGCTQMKNRIWEKLDSQSSGAS